MQLTQSSPPTIQQSNLSTQSNAKQFLDIFNKIEHELQDIYGATKYVGFKRMVETLSQESSLIHEFSVDLMEYLQLRNALVHKTTGEPIAEPHDDVLVAIKKIYQKLIHPPTALDLAARPVYTCSTSDSLDTVVTQMKQHFYSMVPVYHDNRFVGVLSDHSLVLWLGDMVGDRPINLRDHTVADLQDYYGHEDDKFSGYRFTTVDTDVYTIRDFFMSFTSEKKRLGAVFLTRSGHSLDKIEGIITAWDVWKIVGLEQA